MTTITAPISTSTLESTIDVPAGQARTFAINLVTETGVQFSGSAGPIDIEAGLALTIDITISVTGDIFSLGGTVNGVIGTLVLTNSDGSVYETLTIIRDGSFTFDNLKPNSGSYNVTVDSQPADQDCTVTSGTGTIPTANVTDIYIGCSNPGKVAIEGTAQDNSSSSKPAATTDGDRYASIPASTITVLDTSGTVVTTATSQADGYYGVLVDPDQNYIIRVEKGNVLLKAVVPAPEVDTTIDVDPVSTAVVVVLAAALGNGSLGEVGIDFSGLNDLTLETAIENIKSSPGFNTLVAFVENDIATNGDYTGDGSNGLVGGGNSTSELTNIIGDVTGTVDIAPPQRSCRYRQFPH